jgi:hypothetical protein
MSLRSPFYKSLISTLILSQSQRLCLQVPSHLLPISLLCFYMYYRITLLSKYIERSSHLANAGVEFPLPTHRLCDPLSSRFELDCLMSDSWHQHMSSRWFSIYLDFTYYMTSRLARQLVYPTLSDPKHVKVRPDHSIMRLQTETCTLHHRIFRITNSMLCVRSISTKA